MHLNKDKKANCVYTLTNAGTPDHDLTALRMSGRFTVEGGNSTLTATGKDVRFLLATGGDIVLRDLTLDGKQRATGLLRVGGKLALGRDVVITGAVIPHGDDSWYTVEVQEKAQLEMRSNARITGNRIEETGQGAAGIRNKGTLLMRGTSSVENNTVTSGLVDHSESIGSYLLKGTVAGIYNTGTLEVKEQATVRNNTASPSTRKPKYKITKQDPQYGGIYNKGTATVAEGSVTGNSPTQCGGTKPVTGCSN